MNVRLVSGLVIAAATGASILSSCGSQTGLGLNGHLVPSPDPLDLGGIGAKFAGAMVANDDGYSGTISTSNTCSSGAKPIASISPTSGSAPLTVTVTPENAGNCTITFSDSNGLSHTATVNVTTSGIGVTGGSRK